MFQEPEYIVRSVRVSILPNSKRPLYDKLPVDRFHFTAKL